MEDSFSSSSSTTVTSVSKYVHDGVGSIGDAEDSPTDRVEKLLKKYKNRSSRHVQCSQSDASFQDQQSYSGLNKQVLVELELWAAVNDNLRSRGYKSVEFEQDPSPNINPSHCLLLGISASSAGRLTVACLLQELKQRDENIKDLRLKLAQTAHSATLKQPEGSPAKAKSAEGNHVISDLKSQVTRLEYENAKLKVDLQNRPGLQELNACQKRLKELELELLQSKISLSRATSDQTDYMQHKHQTKEICAVLSLAKGNLLLPEIRKMKATLDSHSRLEQHFTSLVELVYDNSNPQLVSRWERPVQPHPSGHDLWCEVTWSHMIMTLQDWSWHLQGLKELEKLAAKVCQDLEQDSSVPLNHSSPRPPQLSSRRREVEGEEDKPVQFTCQDMASLLRRWLTRTATSTTVSLPLLLAMVKHFQKLFDLHSLEAVYPTMTLLSQQVEQYRNVQNRLKNLLKLDANCSAHKLVSTIELVVLKENSHFMERIGRLFGPKMDFDAVVEKLKLCDDFFPAFHSLVLEIQVFLGVNTLSEIIPALHQLRS